MNAASKRSSEPRYISIYCAITAARQSKHTYHHREMLGRCYAERREGRWHCCCCGAPVRAVW